MEPLAEQAQHETVELLPAQIAVLDELARNLGVSWRNVYHPLTANGQSSHLIQSVERLSKFLEIKTFLMTLAEN